MKSLKLVLLFVLFSFAFQITAQTTVFTTKTGQKYHKEDCRYLIKSKRKTTIKKAKFNGYVACKVCVPREKGNVKNIVAKKKSSYKVSTKKRASKKSIATRCTGTTKKGARCKRRTKNNSGRCWQH